MVCVEQGRVVKNTAMELVGVLFVSEEIFVFVIST